MRARPPRMLQSCSPVAALSAAGALPQSVTRRIGTPSNYQRHQRHWCVVQTLFAIDPGPAVAALKLSKRWTWPRRLPLGVRTAATTQPPRHGSGIEVRGLAAHSPKVERWRTFARARRCRPAQKGARLRLFRLPTRQCVIDGRRRGVAWVLVPRRGESKGSTG